MKKTLRFALLSLVAMFSANAMAQTVVGAEDNSSAAWSAFSDYYTIAPNKTLKLKFKNYTSKELNWHNWLVALTNDADRWNNEQGYFEYAVVRADNWAYQPGVYEDAKGVYDKNTGAEKDPDAGTNGVTHNWYNTIRSNYNWDTFRDDMDGSTVEMTIERMNAYIQVYAKITAANSTEYFEEFVIKCDDGTQNIRAFLTIEKCHLVIDDAATETYDTTIPEGLIGEIHNSTKPWLEYSDYYKIGKNQTLTLEFENYTNGEANWNNWYVGAANVARGQEGYNEYFCLRADNWENIAWSNEGVSSNYNWDTFAQDMNGANVKMTITRTGAEVKVRADMTTTENKQFFEEYTKECGDGEQDIYGFLTIEGGHLILKSAVVTGGETAIETVEAVKAQQAGVRYNMAGQQVGAGFKGLVIENGKKFIVK